MFSRVIACRCTEPAPVSSGSGQRWHRQWRCGQRRVCRPHHPASQQPARQDVLPQQRGRAGFQAAAGLHQRKCADFTSSARAASQTLYIEMGSNETREDPSSTGAEY